MPDLPVFVYAALHPQQTGKYVKDRVSPLLLQTFKLLFGNIFSSLKQDLDSIMLQKAKLDILHITFFASWQLRKLDYTKQTDGNQL